MLNRKAENASLIMNNASLRLRPVSMAGRGEREMFLDYQAAAAALIKHIDEGLSEQ